MKTFFRLAIPVLCSIFLFTNCSKDNNQPVNEIEELQHFFSCKLDGADFEVNGFLAYGVDFDDTYNIYGVEEGVKSMYVAISRDLGVGTHQLDENSWALFSYDDGSGYSTHLDGGSGEVTITERTATTAKGTFAFKAVSFEDPNNVLTVTEGKFSVVFR